MTKTDVEFEDDEKACGMRRVNAEDGSEGVEFPVGPSCCRRLQLYHELHHYKVQLYQSIMEEHHGITQRPVWQRKVQAAQKCKKQRVIGEDLSELTQELFDYLKEGKLNSS